MLTSFNLVRLLVKLSLWLFCFVGNSFITNITTNPSYQLSQSGDAKAQSTQVDCGDSTTIDNVEIDQLQARKLLYNGALYLIMPNGDIYNTAGTLINQQ